MTNELYYFVDNIGLLFTIHAIYRVEPFNSAHYSLSTHNWPSQESTKGQYQVETHLLFGLSHFQK